MRVPSQAPVTRGRASAQTARREGEVGRETVGLRDGVEVALLQSARGPSVDVHRIAETLARLWAQSDSRDPSCLSKRESRSTRKAENLNRCDLSQSSSASTSEQRDASLLATVCRLRRRGQIWRSRPTRGLKNSVGSRTWLRSATHTRVKCSSRASSHHPFRVPRRGRSALSLSLSLSLGETHAHTNSHARAAVVPSMGLGRPVLGQ